MTWTPPPLSMAQLTDLTDITLADKIKRRGHAGDWLTGNHRRRLWAALAQQTDHESIQVAADLYIAEAEARLVLWMGRVAWGETTLENGEVAERPLDQEDQATFLRLVASLDKLHARYLARFGVPSLRDRLVALLCTPVRHQKSREPSSPRVPPPDSPLTPPAPIQEDIPLEEPLPVPAPPPLGRLTLRTRGGRAL